MGLDQEDGEVLATRVEKAIHQSRALIHQSKVLEVRSTVLLNELRGERELRGYPMVQSQLDFASIPSPLKWAVSAALQITGAAMGNLQLVDRASGGLRIAAQYGFSKPFLDYFENVHENEAAVCSVALRNRERVIVEDVTQSPIFRGTTALEVLLDAGVRAVQSTPLIASSGLTLGILSTHWVWPHRPSDQVLYSLDLLASHLSDRLDNRV